MQQTFRVGILSTIDNPLLPFYISAIRNEGVNDLVIICDSKISSEKDNKIWEERTGGAFNANNNQNPSIYKLGGSPTPFFFVDNHNKSLSLYQSIGVDCLFNAGTPRKLSQTIFSSIKHGVINVHPGILPKYRGCTAVEWAIYNNDQVGNTAHFMNEQYDAGPIIKEEKYNFPEFTDYQSVRIYVYKQGCILAGKTLAEVHKNNLKSHDLSPQEAIDAKYWSPISDEKLKFVKERLSKNQYAFQTA